MMWTTFLGRAIRGLIPTAQDRFVVTAVDYGGPDGDKGVEALVEITADGAFRIISLREIERTPEERTTGNPAHRDWQPA